MKIANWSPEHSQRAKKIWADYQKSHDLSAQKGQTAGIDPKTGRVWFGESIDDVVAQRQAEGLTSPVRFERVGYPTYYVKGGRA